MKKVEHIRLKRGMSAKELAEEMRKTGVLGAGKIGKAARLVKEMFHTPGYTVFLTIAGALVPGGLRNVFTRLIREGYVDAVVTTGANMVHDMVEALGYRHLVGTFQAEDEKLKQKEIGRIGDIYIEQKAFKGLEQWLHKTVEEIPEEKRRRISSAELLFEIGKRIEDENSILSNAAKKNVPIVCPGLVDSIAGFQLWIFSQEKPLRLDPLLDTKLLVDKVFEAEKLGIIILGGGMPKHYALFASTFRGGVDMAVQITMDRPEPGGLSGATLEEAISWSKVKTRENSVTVICDATIAFPFIVAAALD
ncbi:deoxyhypusine synthase [Candidatus Bathyarchaeota archaeon]|nr:MAG: deoxyhypusine synthase [Candidatus Bathyarchaeota archaeon]